MTALSDLAVGDRVRCTGPLNDGFLGLNHDLVDVEGTVSWVGQFQGHLTEQVAVDWDNGSKLNLLPGDPFVLLWAIGDSVVGPCEQCGALGDVECVETCENKDFRDAEFDGVIEVEDQQ